MHLTELKGLLARARGLLEGAEGDLRTGLEETLGRIEGIVGRGLPTEVHATAAKIAGLVHELEELWAHRVDLADAAHTIEVVVRKEGEELRRLDISGLVPAMRQVGRALVAAANAVEPVTPKASATPMTPPAN